MATKGKFPFALFEKSGKDKDTKAVTKKFGKEGSKKEEAFDKKQAAPKFARGGGIEAKGKTRGKMV